MISAIYKNLAMVISHPKGASGVERGGEGRGKMRGGWCADAAEISIVMFFGSGSGSFAFPLSLTLSHFRTALSVKPAFSDRTPDVGDGNCSLRLMSLLCPLTMVQGCSSGGEGTKCSGLLPDKYSSQTRPLAR